MIFTSDSETIPPNRATSSFTKTLLKLQVTIAAHFFQKQLSLSITNKFNKYAHLGIQLH